MKVSNEGLKSNKPSEVITNALLISYLNKLNKKKNH